MRNKRKGLGYVNIIVSIILAIILSSLTYQGLNKTLTMHKKNIIKQEYNVIVQNEIIKTYNTTWSNLKETQIYIPYNDSSVNIKYEYVKGSKKRGVTDKLIINFYPEDNRLNMRTYDLEKFPET